MCAYSLPHAPLSHLFCACPWLRLRFLWRRLEPWRRGGPNFHYKVHYTVTGGGEDDEEGVALREEDETLAEAEERAEITLVEPMWEREGVR